MLSQVVFKARQVSRQLWVRAALISVLALVALGLSPVARAFLPEAFLFEIDAAKTRSLLDILANSMLAVTTFSLTIMVTAHFSASTQVTPRAHRILRSDTRTQTVLATFVGAFVFSLASIVMLQTGILNQDHYPVIYLMTLFVFVLVIGAILRWIAHLSSLGSMEETIRRVQEQASTAVAFRNANPFLGGQPIGSVPVPEGAHAVAAPVSGFVQHIDTGRIASRACQGSERAFLRCQPGDWVAQGQPLMLYDGEEAVQDAEEHYAQQFILGDTRTFVQDVEFGLMVLSEIAQRALSPSMNDPRTATDILSRLNTVIDELLPEKEPAQVAADSVYAPGLSIYSTLENVFDPIARDGAGHREVQLHVQIALGHLAGHRVPEIAEAARLLSRRALLYAERGLPLEEDVARIRAQAELVVPKAGTLGSQDRH